MSGERFPRVDINFVDEDDMTLLGIASKRGQIHIMRSLLSLPRIDVNMAGSESYNFPLLLAAEHGHGHALQLLLDQKQCVRDMRGMDGKTALMYAAENGHPQALHVLLQNGASINARSDMGDTALMLAAWNGHAQVVQILMERTDTDMHLRNKAGYNALMNAVAAAHEDIVQTLLDRSTSGIDQHDEVGDTALTLAVRSRNQVTLKKLLDAGANVNLRGPKGWTALMLACTNTANHPDTIEVLLKAGADPTLLTPNGATALAIAQAKGLSSAIACLQAAMAPITPATE